LARAVTSATVGGEAACRYLHRLARHLAQAAAGSDLNQVRCAAAAGSSYGMLPAS
jgi:hypothetical protein